MNEYRKELFELEQDYRRLKRTKIVILYRLFLLYYLVAVGALVTYLLLPYGTKAVGIFLLCWAFLAIVTFVFLGGVLSIKSCFYNAQFTHWVMGRYYQKYDPELKDYIAEPTRKSDLGVVYSEAISKRGSHLIPNI